MNETIKVHVVDRGRTFLYLRYIDPVTGKPVEKSSGTAVRKDAAKAAGKWESELREGRYKPASKVTWAEFWKRYDEEVAPGLAEKTVHKSLTIRSVVEAEVNPQRMAQITAGWISTLRAKLRARGCTEATIGGYVAHLSSALTWAVRWGMLAERPDLGGSSRTPKGKRSKGRALCLEEFERLLDKVPDVVLKDEKNPRISRDADDSERIVESWRHYLRGLWLSGLRLGESLELYWDREDRLRVDLTGRRPMLWIPGALQKSGKDEVLPITPDFAEFLLETPPHERRGRVFNPLRRCHAGSRLTNDRVTRLVGAIGKAANVVVWTNPRDAKRLKYASAHDLRRSFGFRWATRIMPAVLQKLMRHESIETTMTYYVEINAAATADAVWSAWKSDTLSDTRRESVEIPAEL